MTENQIKIVTTIGKIGGLATAALGHMDLIPAKYQWFGLVLVLIASTAKDTVMFLTGLWDNAPKAIILFFALAFSVGSLNAQDVKPVGPEQLPPKETSSPGQDLKQAAKDGYSALSQLSFTNGVSVDPFALYHAGDWGAGLAITTANTNGLNAGFFFAGVYETTVSSAGIKSQSWDFYDGGVGLSANGTYDVPLLGRADLSLETGIATDLTHLNAVYSQNLAGASKTFYDNGNWSIGIHGDVGYITKWSQPFYIVGPTITCRLKGHNFLGLW